MPGDGREVLVRHDIHGLFNFVLIPERNVDVGNLKVDRGHEVDTGDLRDFFQNRWRFPGIVCKRGASRMVNKCGLFCHDA